MNTAISVAENMGKLHKIRRAFEQLPENAKKDMARSCYNYGVTFDKSGRAIICESMGVFGCRHRSDQVNGTVVYGPQHGTQNKVHKHKFRYFWPYLRSLLVRHGYVKKQPKPYTRTEKVRMRYMNNRPKDMIKHKAGT